MENYRIVMLPPEELGEERIRLAVEAGDRLVGRADVETTDSAWFITAIYVDEESRRKGYGTALVQHIVNTFDRGGVFMPIEAMYAEDDEVADAFFKAQGNFSVAEQDCVVSVTPEQRAASPAYKRLSEKKRSKAVSYFDLDKTTRTEFLKHLEDKGLRELADEPESEFFKELCFATLENGKVSTAIFFKEHEDDELELSFLYAGKDAKTIMDVLSAAAHGIESDRPKSLLWYDEINEDVEKLSEGLFGDNVSKSRVCVARWNGLPVG